MKGQTVPKSIRLTPADIERIGDLLHQYPEARSESGLMGTALEIGLLILAAGAMRPGLPGRHGGYAEDDLAALLRTRLLPAIEFLSARGALPGIVSAIPAPVYGAAVMSISENHHTSDDLLFDPSAADAIAALGADFMDE
jgi:hypothetical protein